jgi:hypothetical protein
VKYAGFMQMEFEYHLCARMLVGRTGWLLKRIDGDDGSRCAAVMSGPRSWVEREIDLLLMMFEAV